MRRFALAVALAGVVALVVAVLGLSKLGAFSRKFPSEQTPEGAYLRIAISVSEDRLTDVFAYLETDARNAAYTVHEMRAKACRRIRDSYPPDERDKLLKEYAPEGDAKDGPDVFALMAKRRGWVGRLRRDLSGVSRVETEGPRATVVTARGTRYPFRRGEEGIWGLTIFTGELVADSERAQRDWRVVEAAAADYDRAKAREISPPSP